MRGMERIFRPPNNTPRDIRLTILSSATSPDLKSLPAPTLCARYPGAARNRVVWWVNGGGASHTLRGNGLLLFSPSFVQTRQCCLCIAIPLLQHSGGPRLRLARAYTQRPVLPFVVSAVTRLTINK